MTKQTQGSWAVVGGIACAASLVGFAALMVVGGWSFSAALGLALLIFVVVALALHWGFHRSPTSAPARPVARVAPAATPGVTHAHAGAHPHGVRAADDLTRIAGIDASTAEALRHMGITRYDQIAAWSPEEATRVEQGLAHHPGGAAPHDWVGQARVLAAERQPGSNLGAAV